MNNFTTVFETKTEKRLQIQNNNMWVTSEIRVQTFNGFGSNLGDTTINTSATGSLTIEQAEAFVKMVTKAIKDAKAMKSNFDKETRKDNK